MAQSTDSIRLTYKPACLRLHGSTPVHSAGGLSLHLDPAHAAAHSGASPATPALAAETVTCAFRRCSCRRSRACHRARQSRTSCKHFSLSRHAFGARCTSSAGSFRMFTRDLRRHPRSRPAPWPARTCKSMHCIRVSSGHSSFSGSVSGPSSRRAGFSAAHASRWGPCVPRQRRNARLAAAQDAQHRGRVRHNTLQHLKQTIVAVGGLSRRNFHRPSNCHSTLSSALL